jgi:hypothetical protein
MSTIEAPVVPMKFAATAPIARNTTFSAGVASPFTFRCIPPATTKREPINAMKETYSSEVCATTWPPCGIFRRNQAATASPRPTDTCG